MEGDLAPIVEVLEGINQNTSDHVPSLLYEGKTSRNVSRRASLFRRFLAFFCCSAATMSMSRRCSIQIVEPELSSPPSNKSSPIAQVGQISVISLSDELYLSSSGEKISEQDKSSIQSPASEGSDSIQSGDLTSQGYVTSDELQDGGNISGPCSKESDTTESEDSTSEGYVTADESLGETVSEQDRGNSPSPASEESESTESEDSTSHGYVTADELTEVNTISEHDRRSIPSPASEKSDSTQYDDSISEIYATANELTQDTFSQSPSPRPSIESTFPSCKTPTRLSNVSFNI